MNDIAEVLARAQKHAVDYLAGLDQRPLNATATLTDLRRRLDVPLTCAGLGAGRVIDDLVNATEGGHLGSAGGRFFAWVIGGALPSALAADWLVSTWDNNAALYACGPASAVVEEVAGRWIKDLLDLPESEALGSLNRDGARWRVHGCAERRRDPCPRRSNHGRRAMRDVPLLDT